MSQLVCLLIALTGVNAHARQDEIVPEGKSPDKRRRIFVEQDSPETPIFYVIRNRKGGAVLGRVKSSYQPESGELEDFSWNQSHPTWIYWRPDSRWVAIDEANHGSIGTVILLRRGSNGFEQVPLDCNRLMAATKEAWDRGRLFFADNSWLRQDRARVFILGSVPNAKAGDYDRIGYEVTIDLRHEGAILKITKFNQ